MKINRLLMMHLLAATGPAEEARINRWRARASENEAAYQAILAEWKLELDNFESRQAARERGKDRILAYLEQMKQHGSRPLTLSWRQRIPRPLRVAASVVIGICIFLYVASKIEIGGPDKNNTAGTNLTGTQEAGVIDAQGIVHAPAEIKRSIVDGFRDGYRKGLRDEARRQGYFIVERDPDAAPDARNTLFTYRHGHYRMFLPDGTEIWLNDTSAVSWQANFPVDFPAVQVRGEVYAEMGPFRDGKPPFVFSFGSVNLYASSGRFDIRAYPEDSLITVTAIKEPLRVKPGSSVITLQPGEQLLIRGEKTQLLKNPDIEKVLAWKRSSK